MGAVFISYRRGDSSGAAGRLFDRLVSALGRNSIFMDVDSIEPGSDFINVLTRYLEQCEVMLVVMGPNWLAAKDGHGRRRLDDSSDFVRLEIAGALAREIRVIPILVDGATAISAAELPDDLKLLARRQAIEVRHDRFGSDADQLAETLRVLILAPPVSARPASTVSKSEVSGTWSGELRHADCTFKRTWILKSDGQFESSHNELGFVEKGSWRLESDELLVIFPWGTIFRGQVNDSVCRGICLPQTGAQGDFEMHKIGP